MILRRTARRQSIASVNQRCDFRKFIVVCFTLLACRYVHDSRASNTLPLQFRIIVLTMNRPVVLAALLRSLEDTDYSNNRVELEVHVDLSANQSETVELVRAFNFSHGRKRIFVSHKALGLASSWYEAWEPNVNDSVRSIILEDDILLSPDWYKWLMAAWTAYGKLDDLAGISLMRQTLVPLLPSKQDEIVNGHIPFLYSLVGSIAFSPDAEVWSEFLAWRKSIAADFDVTTPGLITSEWWTVLDKRHMWTQHFIYFTLCRNLYTLYINLPGQQTIASHVRAKGEHYDKNYGPDYVTAKSVKISLPRDLARYTWDGSPLTRGRENQVTMDLLSRVLARKLERISEKYHSVSLIVLRQHDDAMAGIINSMSPTMTQKTVILSTNLRTVRLLLKHRPDIQSFWIHSKIVAELQSSVSLRFMCTTGAPERNDISYLYIDQVVCKQLDVS